MSRTDIVVVKTAIKKVDVPDDQNDRKHENQKGWCLGSASGSSRMESKRLMSRIDFKVVDMRIKKVDVPHRHHGCQNWNQKG